MIAPKISIIVPVYKVEQYLSRCIESILSQTFQDFELLLIDDGSPDNSGVICDEYATKDNRVRVFHKENGGVSSARNYGLMNASGEWISFVDGDDWVDQNFLQNFVEYFNPGVDLVIQSFKFYFSDLNKFKFINLPTFKFDNSASLVAYLYKADDVHNGFIWHRIFKRSIIIDNSLYFMEGVPFAEDGCFNLNYLLFSSKTIMTDKVGYNYVVGNSGLTLAGKSLSFDVYNKLGKEFSRLIYLLINKELISKDIEEQLKLFYWGLIDDWLFKRSVFDYTTFTRSIETLRNYFDLDFQKKPRCAFMISHLIKIFKEEPSKCSYWKYKLFRQLSNCRLRYNNLLNMQK